MSHESVNLPESKEAIFQKLLFRKQELMAKLNESREKRIYNEEEFMDAEIAVEKAAKSALEAGLKEEHDRLMEEHKSMLEWRKTSKW